MKRCIFAFAFLALSAMFAHALHTPAPQSADLQKPVLPGATPAPGLAKKLPAPSGLKAMAQR